MNPRSGGPRWPAVLPGAPSLHRQLFLWLLLPQVVNTIAPVDGKAVKAGWEGTNYGFRTDAAYTGNELAQGTDCKMARP